MPSGRRAARHTKEHARLDEAAAGKKWRRWGTYLAERQWGSVREDYSQDGEAWKYFSHEHARSRAYRWGEDGLLGLSDNRGLVNLAPALWNGKDPFLKERLFGLTGPEGNHGEDVKEVYYYLEQTPTCSYARALYKYPQVEFPYARLRELAAQAGRGKPEPELADTGVFDGDRYFDVQVEYAKGDTDDVLVTYTLTNRGPEAAPLHLLPQLWFRNVWSWDKDTPKPDIRAIVHPSGAPTLELTQDHLGTMWLHCEGSGQSPALYFTENETNKDLLYKVPNPTAFVKDAFHQLVVGFGTL